MDPATSEFIYVPIPEGKKKRQYEKLATTYDTVEPGLLRFAAERPQANTAFVTLPRPLIGAATHLDPDFHQLTYGDNGERRGKQIASFGPGDVIVFYAGLRPVSPCPYRLVYGLIGLYRVAGVARASEFPESRWHENAHLRRLIHRPTDVIVHAHPGSSGRLRRCIPIGEYRRRAYRVRRDLLDTWGGISSSDGYIQRCGSPPFFLDAERFIAWFDAQGAELVAHN
jgi:hypothetical protein